MILFSNYNITDYASFSCNVDENRNKQRVKKKINSLSF